MTPIPAPKVFGLTGGIGSGKSLVAKLFEKQGVPTVDADQVARELRAPGGAASEAILNRFQTLDRLELRKILATDPEAKKDLEKILHPLILTKSNETIDELKKSHSHAPFILYEASLLIEAGRVSDFDGIIVVTSPRDARIARIMARDQVAVGDAQAMLEAQNSDEFRLKHAQFVIKNDADLNFLEREVRKVLDQIIST